jgi:hypothetical protein
MSKKIFMDILSIISVSGLKGTLHILVGYSEIEIQLNDSRKLFDFLNCTNLFHKY